MLGAVNRNDPRVQRTRQLLLQAFMALLEERHNIHSISVQEITKLATVNRATFYAHFEDKYALLESWMREKFHRALLSQLPLHPRCKSTHSACLFWPYLIFLLAFVVSSSLPIGSLSRFLRLLCNKNSMRSFSYGSSVAHQRFTLERRQ